MHSWPMRCECADPVTLISVGNEDFCGCAECIESLHKRRGVAMRCHASKDTAALSCKVPV